MEKAQKVRCLNCFQRIEVPSKTEKLECPNCGVAYVIAWRKSHPKIAGTPKD